MGFMLVGGSQVFSHLWVDLQYLTHAPDGVSQIFSNLVVDYQ